MRKAQSKIFNILSIFSVLKYDASLTRSAKNSKTTFQYSNDDELMDKYELLESRIGIFINFTRGKVRSSHVTRQSIHMIVKLLSEGISSTITC